ncbi:hypothetical protein [Flavivirga algicola]|uniref:T9SS type A sorting domain-containing protein n=1 Tax=Flavivirga algicola TaxID=2729136 RepID=A0ABX1RVV5_9FLAO|nr:hypothetical protein [Flavivirga algicola]NMH86808.1 hypothetical protein [Flavivirga algicola]
MKKITLLVALCLTALNYNAQVVSTVFGSDANEAAAEWEDVEKSTDVSTFNQFQPEEAADNGKFQTRGPGANNIGTMNYVGTYSGTLSSSDVIYCKIKHQDLTTPEIEKINVSYKENGGTTLTESLAFVSTTAGTDIQEIIVTPGFTDGATLSDLSVTFTTDDINATAFDVIRIYEFSIGPNPTLSTKSNIIEGARVFAKEGNITVKGANLDAVYALTGQRVGAINLSNGIYLVKISKDDKAATVKVAL